MNDIKKIVLELFDLPHNGIDEVMTTIFKYSGLGRLEFYDMMIDSAIGHYDNCKEQRNEVGEIT